MTDARNQFIDYMRSEGVVPADSSQIVAGKFCRFDLEGEARGKKSGFCKFHDDDYPNGVFADLRVHDKNNPLKWKPKIERSEPMTAAQREELRQRSIQRTKELQAETAKIQSEAASACEHIWSTSKPASPDHPYLARKGIRPHSLRESRNALIVPVRIDGKLSSLQFITTDGAKKFKKGGAIKGGYTTIGKPAGTLVVCEGYATGATIHEATGYAVVVAFDAGNLAPVAQIMREKFHDARIIIAADDDRFNGAKNPGIEAGLAAAASMAGIVRRPVFKSDDGKPTDFNDLAAQCGLDEVRAQIETGKKSWTDQDLTPTERIAKSVPSEIIADGKKNAALHSAWFAEELGNVLLFDDFSSSWYRFNKVWQIITEGDSDRVLVRWFDTVYSQAYSSRWLSDVKKLLKIRLGRSPIMNEANEASDTWNTDRNLLPMRNGVLNLKTRTLLPHAPELMMNWFIPYDYEPTAVCPTIDDYLKTLSQGDKRVEELALCYLWAILNGASDLQKYLELIGKPGTGKSTFIHIATRLVGSDNTVVTTMATLHENQFETAAFYGKRLAIISDADKWAGSIDTFKAVTGQDPIRYEVKGKQQGKPFVYGGMLLIAGNNPIQSTDSSTALVRRRLTIYVDKLLDKSKMQERFLEKLDAEIPGLLNKLLTLDEAYVRRVITGFDLNKSRSLVETDVVAMWLDECCVYDPSSVMMTKIGVYKKQDGVIHDADRYLYPSFMEYVERSGRSSRVNLNDFSSRVIEICLQSNLNVAKTRNMHGMHLTNIRLKGQNETILCSPITRQGINEDPNEDQPSLPNYAL